MGEQALLMSAHIGGAGSGRWAALWSEVKEEALAEGR